MIFSKTVFKFLNISTSFKKEISILSQIAKKLEARQFLQNCLFEKTPGTTKFFPHFFGILKTVIVAYLTF